MKFLLFYILRRFFVRLEYTDKKITLTKRIIIEKTAVIPLSAIIKTVTRISPIMRIFRAREVTVYTLNGKIEFFLNQNEQPPFIPKMPEYCIKPRFFEILFGAFIDTRALAGIVFFAAMLQKIGSIVGGSYFDGIISALMTTAEKLSETLLMIHIAVPRIAAFAAAFATFSWIFAFLSKLIRLSGYCLSKSGKFVFVKSGVITLYETALVQNTNALLLRKTAVCMFIKRFPVYYGADMIFPAASERIFAKISERFFGIPNENTALLKTPLRKIFGHITVPFWAFIISSALLFVFYYLNLNQAQILKTVLYCAVFSSGYIAACGIALVKNAESSFGDFRIKLSFRRGTALYSVFFPREISRGFALSQNIFQRTAHLCDYKAFIVGRKSFRARQLPLKSARR